MKAVLLLSALLSVATVAKSAPVAVADLAKPPPDAERLTIMSPAGRHGTSYIWTTPAGVRMGRESLDLRGQAFEIDSATRLGPDGAIQHTVIRGFTPQGDAAESFDLAAGTATWKSPVDAGSRPYAGPALYVAFGGPMEQTADFVEALVAAPGRSMALLPGGQAHAEPLTPLVVGQGATQRTVTAYAITGFSNAPVAIWVDEKNRFFAFDQGLTWIRAGYEADQPRLDKAQDDALAARSPVLAKALAKTPPGPVAFTHVRDFVDGSRFLADQTVVVNHGVITAAGPASSTAVPAGALVVPGEGRTLVPGLWDSHQHFGDDSSGPSCCRWASPRCAIRAITTP